MKRDRKTFYICLTGLMAALACVSNYISIATPASRIHIGNAVCVLSGLLLGPLYGFFAAAIGNGLFDIIGGYGMEFTLRLKKRDFADEELELENICGIFQQIAAVTFETNELFLPYEYLSSGQTAGIDAGHESGITGFITVPDVKAQPITTPFGALEFVEFVGVTKAELDAVQNKQMTVEELYGKLGSDLTDYRRESVI